MFKNFDEIEKYVLDSKIVKTVALANAEDNHTLEALVMAKRKGLVKGILIGNTSKIKELLKSMNEQESDYEFIEEADELASAKIAVSLVKKHKADMPMKGLMMTSSFMKAILNKEEGLIKEDCILSQATVLEYTEKNKLMIISGCAVNIMPDLASGNILSKGLVFIAHLKTAGVLLGTTSPVIMTSRTDTIEEKYLSILTSIYCSLK